MAGGVCGSGETGEGQSHLDAAVEERLDTNAAESASILALLDYDPGRYARLEAAMIESERNGKPVKWPDDGPDLFRLARLSSRRAALEELRDGVRAAGAAGLTAAHVDFLGGGGGVSLTALKSLLRG